jgi:hypothetical protein
MLKVGDKGWADLYQHRLQFLVLHVRHELVVDYVDDFAVELDFLINVRFVERVPA